MATGIYPPFVPQQYFDNSGNPLAAGTLETFIAGTTTHISTFSDVNLTIANANPMTLDASGRPQAGNIFLRPGASYKFVLKDALGATMATPDNILIAPAGTSLDIIGRLGEPVVTGNLLFLGDGTLNTTAGKWYLASKTFPGSSLTPQLGFATSVGAAEDVIVIRQAGNVTNGLSGLIPGEVYYVGTAGGLTTTQGGPQPPRFVGQADGTTTLVASPNPPVRVQVVPINPAHGSFTLNAAQANTFLLVADGNCTLTDLINGTDGQNIHIRFLAYTGPWTLTLAPFVLGGPGFRFGSTVTGPLTVTVASAADYISCIYFSNTNAWDVVYVSKGYGVP